MKAIIIAAGCGCRLKHLTKDRPKCLLDINGKSIMQRQIEVLRECGINDISVVRGYRAELINFPAVKYYLNDNYLNNNILNSLFYAEKEMEGEFIVIYSDILFDKSVVEKLLESKRDISLIIDTDWQEYYIGRTDHPTSEAENVIIKENRIIEIGKHVGPDEATGEFIGMAKFSKKGGEIFKKEFYRVKNDYLGKPFQKSKTFEKAYLTDMFQELIDKGIGVYPVEIKKNWWEIDTEQDFEKVKVIFS